MVPVHSTRASRGPPDDQQAEAPIRPIEFSANALGIARIIEPHVARVVLANLKAVKGITRAGAKTDKIDARMLAKLLAGGFLPAVWLPDERTRILRRRISARAQLVRQLPPDERETVAACLRQIEFLDSEIALIERALAEQVLARAEMRRLLTLPGVNFVTAAALMAAIGDIRRFPTARRLVSYLGLDPRVRHPVPSRPDTAASPSKAGARRGTCWSKRPGTPPAHRRPCAPSINGSPSGAAATSPPSRSPASSP
jgi:transposase